MHTRIESWTHMRFEGGIVIIWICAAFSYADADVLGYSFVHRLMGTLRLARSRLPIEEQMISVGFEMTPCESHKIAELDLVQK